MLDAKTMIEALERNYHTLERGLGPQWEEFSRRAGDLADRFEFVAGEDQPKLANRSLEAAVNKLYKVCLDYPYVAALFDSTEVAPPEAEVGVGVSRKLPTPAKQDIVKVKETANRYYSLLAGLKKAAEQTKEGGHDR